MEENNRYDEESVNNPEVLNEQKELFDFYLKLPSIVAIIIIVLSILFGILGFLSFEQYMIFFLISSLIGIVIGAVAFFILRIKFSYQILHICYLEKLCGKVCEKGTAKEINEEKLEKEKVLDKTVE